MKTKKNVISEFRELYNSLNLPKGDVIMRREEWNNYTDRLCENGEITQYQRDHWTNPF